MGSAKVAVPHASVLAPPASPMASPSSCHVAHAGRSVEASLGACLARTRSLSRRPLRSLDRCQLRLRRNKGKAIRAPLLHCSAQAGSDAPAEESSTASKGPSTEAREPTGVPGLSDPTSNQKKPPVNEASSSPPAPRPNSGNNRQDKNSGDPWYANLLPDFRGLAYVLFHLAALVLASKVLGIDNFVRGMVPKMPSVRLVAADSVGTRRLGRREAADAQRGSLSNRMSITVARDEAGRKPCYVVSNLIVPFSEFLFHVKKDNVQSVSVDGDKVSFVVRRPDLIQQDHKASSLLPDILALQQLLRDDPKLRRGLELAGRGGADGAGAASRKVLKGAQPFSLQLQLTALKPSDLSLPYGELLAKNVEFGTPEKVPYRFVNNIAMSLLYAGVLASIISRITVQMPNRMGGRQKNRRGRGPGIMFADVAGVDEAKEELEEIVEYLRMPEKFTRLGARPPRGVLLVGPPGTGKTMLAKAVAGEADVPFVSCSGSEFVELYVGLGASRVRDLFAQAKKEAPSIVFIDEIDSVAKVRDGRARSVGNDEREQTLNQLLTEMDGFDSNTAVIVLAATNRADVLDPALRRPGRFDRIVAVEPPDRKGRVAILNVHIEKQQLPLADDVDVRQLATATSGFTGADLANLVNEAALLAARDDDCTSVAKVHFERAVERALAGIEKKRSALGASEKAVVARHEVGHAILGAAVAKILPNNSVVQKISIVPRSGGALGFAYIPPAPEGEERLLLFVDELRGQLATMLGGRAAEEVAYAGRVSTGAMDDIRRATDLAYKAIAEFGLSSVMGPVSLSTLSGGGMDASIFGAFPEQGRLAELVQQEVQSLLQEALAVARHVVEKNLDLLHGLGSQLQVDESVEGEVLAEWLEKVDETEELRSFIQRASLLPTYALPDQLEAPQARTQRLLQHPDSQSESIP